MKDVFYCEQCPGSVLRLIGTTKTRKNKAYPHGIRVRKFICDVCDNQTAIYADNKRDDVIIPEVLKDEIKEMHKQESDSAHRLIEPIDEKPYRAGFIRHTYKTNFKEGLKGF